MMGCQPVADPSRMASYSWVPRLSDRRCEHLADDFRGRAVDLVKVATLSGRHSCTMEA
jgi:hypothetical protein